MRILIPMAGAGRRFADAGYKTHKPFLPTYDWGSGRLLPMVVCAVNQLPGVAPGGENIIFIDRPFHRVLGGEDEIKRYFPGASFVTAETLTEGQACSCLLARSLLDPGEELLIAGCDNGMVLDAGRFEGMSKTADELVFTYRHNAAVLKNPDAYGWVKVDAEGNIQGLSIKKRLSDNPMEDHAVVATFYFRKAAYFLEAADKMIRENDRVNGEFYVDKVAEHILGLGMRSKVFEIDRYIGWGTPEDYEEYQKTYEYWFGFLAREKLL